MDEKSAINSIEDLEFVLLNKLNGSNNLEIPNSEDQKRIESLLLVILHEQRDQEPLATWLLTAKKSLDLYIKERKEYIEHLRKEKAKDIKAFGDSLSIDKKKKQKN